MLVAVLAMAVVSTIMPFGAFLAALHYIDPTRALVTSTLEPVIAGVAAFALLGESFSATQLLGATLVLVAIVVVQRPVATRSQYRLRSADTAPADRAHDFTQPPRGNGLKRGI